MFAVCAMPPCIRAFAANMVATARKPARRRVVSTEPRAAKFKAAPSAPTVKKTYEGARVGFAQRSENGESGSLAMTIALDGTGRFVGSTSDVYVDHLVSTFAAHSGFDVTATARPAPAPHNFDFNHHLTPSDHGAFVGEVLGMALLSAIGYARTDRRCLRRIGTASATADDAFVHVSLELANDNHTYVGVHDARSPPEDDDTALPEPPALDVSPIVFRFLCTLANETRVLLHVLLISGVRSRAVADAEVKAVAIALRAAVAET